MVDAASFRSSSPTQAKLVETLPLLALAGFNLGLLGFIILAAVVKHDYAAHIDRLILLSLRHPQDISDPLGPRWFEETARDMTALGSHLILGLISLSATLYLVLAGKARTALFLLVAIGGGMMISALMKMGFERPRPDLVPHGMQVYTASFPSGHAMLSAITYLTLGALLARVERRRRIKAFIMTGAVLLTVLVGFSRIYLGVHWPTDVLAGWTLGAAWACLCWALLMTMQRKGTVETPAQASTSPL